MTNVSANPGWNSRKDTAICNCCKSVFFPIDGTDIMIQGKCITCQANYRIAESSKIATMNEEERRRYYAVSRFEVLLLSI